MAKKIRLFCAAGMSTSLLVNKMKDAAKAAGKDYDITAFSLNEFDQHAAEADVCLLGPQVRYALPKLQEAHPEYKIIDIPMQMYGMMDGKGVISMEGTELVASRIIASVGTARSNYIGAIDVASQGDFEEAERLIAEGKAIFLEGHKAHTDLLAIMAKEEIVMDLLLTHAEDQLMSAEAFGILAEKFVDLYKKLK